MTPRRSMILTIVLLLASCSIEPSWRTLEIRYDIPYHPASVTEALLWCYNELTYTADVQPYCQNPEETWARRAGDCEDYCVLFMFFTARDCASDPVLLLVGYKSPDKANHAIVEIGSCWYEITAGAEIRDRSPYTVFLAFDYPTTIWQVHVYHRLL